MGLLEFFGAADVTRQSLTAAAQMAISVGWPAIAFVQAVSISAAVVTGTGLT